VLELATLGGFRIEGSQLSALPYAVSPLNGRGRLERTLAFSAVKLDGPGDERRIGPPAWLVLPHLAVPSARRHEAPELDDPLTRTIWELVDGERSIQDIAKRLLPHLQSSPMSFPDVEDAVRECLATTHPGARASR
jgi:hypothetical protein